MCCLLRCSVHHPSLSLVINQQQKNMQNEDNNKNKKTNKPLHYYRRCTRKTRLSQKKTKRFCYCRIARNYFNQDTDDMYAPSESRSASLTHALTRGGRSFFLKCSKENFSNNPARTLGVPCMRSCTRSCVRAPSYLALLCCVCGDDVIPWRLRRGPSLVLPRS